MNNQFTLQSIIAIICLLSSLNISAANTKDTNVTSQKSPLILNPTQAQLDSILKVLDDVIVHKADYRARRIASADSLIKVTALQKGKQRVDAMKKAYSYCSHVSGKKSMEILDRMTELSEYKTDKNLQQWVKDSRAYIFAVIGMYHRSYALLNNVNVKGYDHATRTHHYEVVTQVLNWIGTAFCIDGALKPDEEKKMHIYSDSLLTNDRDSISMVFTEVDLDIFKKDFNSAIRRLADLYPKTSGQNETYVYAVLSDVLTHKGDSLGMIFYSVKTSISDIQAGTTEYMCLPSLAQNLFKRGDVDRAYNYLKCCIEDAHVYPSQFLISQATNFFPMIDEAYQQKKADYEASQRHMLILIFGAVMLVLIILGLLLFLRHRQKLMKQLKNANTLLAQTNEDLEAANNVKNHFLQSMEHELHTPMNAIDGFAQLLCMNDGQIDEESRKEMTSSIRTSSQQLKMIIDNTIMLTEYEKPHVEEKMHQVNISDMFEMLNLEIYNSKADKVNVEYRNDVPEDFVFISSKSHIETILRNLIDNSLKFTHEGKVSVSAELTADRKVLFRVSDTGIGISADKVDTIFERFAKGWEFSQGVGLGLTLCYRLTTLLGGEISLEETSSDGTTFRVTLPSAS